MFSIAPMFLAIRFETDGFPKRTIVRFVLMADAINRSGADRADQMFLCFEPSRQEHVDFVNVELTLMYTAFQKPYVDVHLCEAGVGPALAISADGLASHVADRCELADIFRLAVKLVPCDSIDTFVITEVKQQWTITPAVAHAPKIASSRVSGGGFDFFSAACARNRSASLGPAPSAPNLDLDLDDDSSDDERHTDNIDDFGKGPRENHD